MVNRIGIISAIVLAGCLCLSSSAAFAQEAEPFTVRVESDVVLLRVQVFRKGFRTKPFDSNYMRCMHENHELLYSLPMSQPFLLEKDCTKDSEVNDLELKDFHLFEDGVEQQIDNVIIERAPWSVERDVHRDFLEFHKVWSHTPRGIWRASAVRPDWSVSAEYFYRIAYRPPKLKSGGCHWVKITVDRPNTEVLATKQYCYIEHPATDPLMGTAFSKKMEAELRSDNRPEVPLSMQAGFFYPDAHGARVDIVLGFPFEKLKYERVEFETRATIGVLGMVYTTSGSLVARFSDSAIVSGDFAGAEAAYADLPSRYETQIDLAPGHYDLRIVLSDGSNFGRADVPITIDEFDGTQLALSSVFFFKRLRVASAAAQEAKKINLAPDYVPLVSQDNEVTPDSDPTFEPKQAVPVYFEVYEPLLGQEPEVTVQAHMRIVDRATGEVRETFPWFDATDYRQPGKNTFAIMKFLFFDHITSGEFRVEAQAKDSVGHTTPWRDADFNLASIAAEQETPRQAPGRAPGQAPQQPPRIQGVMPGAEQQNCATLSAGVEHGEALSRFCQFALMLEKRLPDVICQRTLKTDDPDSPFQTATAEVRYENGNDSYSKLTVDGKPFTSRIPPWEFALKFGYNDFGRPLEILFIQEPSTRFKFLRETQWKSTPALLFEFQMASGSVGWTLTTSNARKVNVSLKGRFWLDASSDAVLRVEASAEHLDNQPVMLWWESKPDPHEPFLGHFPFESWEMSIDYANKHLGDGTDFVLPTTIKEMTCTLTGVCNRERITFDNCHKFGADSRILEDVTQ